MLVHPKRPPSLEKNCKKSKKNNAKLPKCGNFYYICNEKIDL